MTEGLFVLIVIYAAYVFYVVLNDKKTIAKFITPTTELEKQAVSVESLPFKSALTEKTTIKTLEENITKKPAPTTKQTTQKKGLKDPKTGDIATTYSNYRFSKRWIKEALVTEGLLEKVYKNNELNAEIEASIKAAIAKLESIEKYKV